MSVMLRSFSVLVAFTVSSSRSIDRFAEKKRETPISTPSLVFQWKLVHAGLKAVIPLKQYASYLEYGFGKPVWFG